MKRVFAAIVPGEAAVGEIASHIDELRTAFPDVRASWVRPENLHLTLHFAGDVDEDRLRSFQSHIEKAANITPPFPAALGEAGAFVDKRMGRSVLWVGLRSAGNEGQLIASAARGIKTDEDEKSTSFVSHVTVARIRGAAHTELLMVHRKGTFSATTFAVNEFVVVESTLTPTGPIYKALSRHPLKGQKHLR